jgi:hypothetical protein
MNSLPYPPKLAQCILLGFLRDDLAEEVAGDLDEKFYSTLKNQSLFKAKLNYWYQVLHYVRPFAIRNQHQPITTTRLCFEIILLSAGGICRARKCIHPSRLAASPWASRRVFL